MKNSSWKHPFPTFSDKMFDGNKDGKLDAFETAFRDAHIEEMSRNATKQNTQPKSGFTIPENPAEKTDYNGTENKSNTDAPSASVQLVCTFLAIIVIFGGIILALSSEGTMFIKAIIAFAAAYVAIGLLKLGGVYNK